MHMRTRHLGSAAHSSISRIELESCECCNEDAASDQDHANNVPPDADIIEEGHNAHAKYIERGMQSQYDAVDHQGRQLCWIINTIDTAGGCGKAREPGVKQHVNGDGCAIVDTGGDSDLTDEVEPASIPSPDRSIAPTKLGCPVIEATGGRKSGSQFSHTQGYDDHEDSDDRPAN